MKEKFVSQSRQYSCTIGFGANATVNLSLKLNRFYLN